MAAKAASKSSTVPRPGPVRRSGRLRTHRVAILDGPAETGEVLHGGELEIQPRLIATDEVTQQWPRPGAAQFGELVPCRPSHPVPQVQVLGQKRTRDAGATADGSSTQSEVATWSRWPASTVSGAAAVVVAVLIAVPRRGWPGPRRTRRRAGRPTGVRVRRWFPRTRAP